MARRYQRGNQKPYIKEEQTIQWPEDTKGVIRSRISKKNKQHNGQELEDTKGVIRSRISKKDRQHKKRKIDRNANNDKQNTTQEINDKVTRIPLNR
jgi:hypothetical protein